MTFPATPLDAKVEIDVGGWADITDRVRVSDGITITRGKGDWAAQTDPSTCRMKLDNDGRFSPRNPNGDYFEKIGRNTPLRVSLPYGSTYLALSGDTGDQISAPDASGISVTGDLDVRLDVTLDNPGAAQGLASKYTATGNQRSWSLELAEGGTVTLYWSSDGTLTNRTSASSTAPIAPGPHERIAIRVALDVDNGASGNTVTFYTSTSISETWTQLGDAVTASGTTSIFDGTASLIVAYGGGASSTRYARGKLHAFEVRSGSTVVAGLDFSAGLLFGVPYSVGSTTQAAAVSDTVTMDVDTAVTAGDTIFLTLGSSGGATVTSVSDSTGNTYGLAASATGGTPRTHLYTATATTALAVGDTITAVFSTAGNAYNVVAAACAGVDAVDKMATGFGTSTSPSATTAALSSAYQLVIAAISNGNGGGSPTWATGLTAFATEHSAGTAWTSAAREVVESSSAVTASATITSAAWTALVATFTPAANLGTGPYKDGYGNVWTLAGNVTVDDRDYRFYGEVSSWPPRWDISGNDVTVSIEASGISRRLGQGASPLRSAMYRAHTNPSLTRVKAYWSCEDLAGATSLASGLPGGTPMTITGTPDLASYDGFAASAAMPTMKGATFTGTVPAYTATTEAQVYFFLFVDTAVSAETNLFSVRTTGTVRRWDVNLLANGNLRARAYDDTGTEVDDGAGSLAAEMAFSLNSRGFLILDLQLTQNGSDIDWFVALQDFTSTDTISGSLDTAGAGGTITSETFGRVTSVTIGDGGGLDDVKLSHIVVSDDIDTWLTDVADAVLAYNGERPSTRFSRLCDEEGINFVEFNAGETANLIRMGWQRSKTLLELLDECADTDNGMRFEPRDRAGAYYRTRTSFYNQAAALTLDYDSGEVAPPLEPVDDDQQVRNDVTVTRDGGSSARAELTTGALSTAAPPDGVGRYDTSETISLVSDNQLPDQAYWRLHLGTTDEQRYPTITVDLARLEEDGKTTLAAQARAVDIGDRSVVENTPGWLPPGDVSQIVLGSVETLTSYGHKIAFNCSPESPYRPATVDGDRKVQADGSVTAASFVAGTDTSMSVSVTDGPLWTTDSDDLPINILVSGVELEVTAISGTSSPQTFTVTATPVNGVTKTIASGAAVQVAAPARTSL